MRWETIPWAPSSSRVSLWMNHQPIAGPITTHWWNTKTSGICSITTTITPEFDKNRSARVDSLFFNADGTIQKVTPTLRGVGITDARKEIQLDRYSRLSNQGATIDYLNQANKFEGWKTLLSKNGAWVQYNRVNFGDSTPRKVKARVTSDNGGTLQIRINGTNGPVISEIKVPKTDKWTNIESSVRSAQTGIHDLYVSLKGNGKVEIDWISFQ